MKDFTSDEIAAYSSRTIIARSLIWVQPKDRATGNLISFGFWNGTGDVDIDVIDGVSLATVSRGFTSRGAILTIGDIPFSEKLDVMSVQVSLSQLNADVENAVRGYDMRNAPIQIYRALFNTADPRAIVAPARCRLVGFVNTSTISTPAENGSAAVTLECVGCVRELTRTNTDLRSDESQQRRVADDRFFRHVAATGQVQVFWGQNKAVP